MKTAVKTTAVALLTACALMVPVTWAADGFSQQRTDVNVRGENKLSWPMWQEFKASNIEGGRVIDFSDERIITTSEGQSYALFFALVDGDKETFARLLDYSNRMLRQSNGLYAWLYGRQTDENGQLRTGVLDRNNATDADLFTAYCLLEAGRLWNVPEYTRQGRALCSAIKQMLVEIDSLGTVLLPGANGFVHEGYVTLNMSYYPYFLLKRLALEDPIWNEVNQSVLRALLRCSPSGAVPDWANFNARGQYLPDAADEGGYNAIRVYLFSGMINPGDPVYHRLYNHFEPMINTIRVQKTAPSSVEVNEMRFAQMGPYYLTAAFLPYLRNEKSASLLRYDLYKSGIMKNSYYRSVLTLFALGFDEGRFAFDENGQLVLGTPFDVSFQPRG